MAQAFIETNIFSKCWSELGLDDESLRAMQSYIVKNPSAGKVIKGTGGLRKLRWNLSDTGKSGGIRALYVHFIQHEKIFLINCYGKSKKDTITDKEKAIYKALIDAIKEELQ